VLVIDIAVSKGACETPGTSEEPLRERYSYHCALIRVGTCGSLVAEAQVTSRKVAGSRPDEVNDFYQFI
jgi:purine-nucleoside phosphorylase